MKLFDENMSSVDAWRVLFTTMEGKTAEERAAIMAEYEAVLPAIIRREVNDRPTLTAYRSEEHGS